MGAVAARGALAEAYLSAWVGKEGLRTLLHSFHLQSTVGQNVGKRSPLISQAKVYTMSTPFHKVGRLEFL